MRAGRKTSIVQASWHELETSLYNKKKKNQHKLTTEIPLETSVRIVKVAFKKIRLAASYTLIVSTLSIDVSVQVGTPLRHPQAGFDVKQIYNTCEWTRHDTEAGRIHLHSYEVDCKDWDALAVNWCLCRNHVTERPNKQLNSFFQNFKGFKSLLEDHSQGMLSECLFYCRVLLRWPCVQLSYIGVCWTLACLSSHLQASCR